MTKKSVRFIKSETFIGLANIAQKFSGMKEWMPKNDWFTLIIIYAAIEMILEIYLKTKCKYGNRFTKSNIPLLGKAALLRELEVIDDKMYGYISIVKSLRDRFAHRLEINDDWGKKLVFDKSDSYYEQYVKKSQRKPEEFRQRLFYVLERLLLIGTHSLSYQQNIEI